MWRAGACVSQPLLRQTALSGSTTQNACHRRQAPGEQKEGPESAEDAKQAGPKLRTQPQTRTEQRRAPGSLSPDLVRTLPQLRHPGAGAFAGEPSGWVCREGQHSRCPARPPWGQRNEAHAHENMQRRLLTASYSRESSTVPLPR